MAHICTSTGNQLVDSLASDDNENLSSLLERVQMPLGDILHESGDNIRYVYFPVSSVVAKLHIMSDGSAAGIAMVGNEGIVGLAAVMGGKTMTNRAIVQSAGYGYRSSALLLHQQIMCSKPLRNLFLRYSQALITQIAQTAVCNRHHSIEQQLVRWLLMNLDRLPVDHVVSTQELIANMLGVRREGVTEAAGKLQRAGVIAYCRGQISILDRPGLEARCCECYQVVKNEYDRLLPALPPSLPDGFHCRDVYSVSRVETHSDRFRSRPAASLAFEKEPGLTPSSSKSRSNRRTD